MLLVAKQMASICQKERHTQFQVQPARKPVPEGGYGFLACLVDGVTVRTPTSVIEELEAPHRHGGNPGYAALLMLRAYLLQFVLNERYAKCLLKTFGHGAFLGIG